MNERPTQLRAGPVSAVFYGGDVRYIGVAGREVVRRICVTVRDTTWGTLRPTISNLTHSADDRGFTVRYTAGYQCDPIDLVCDVQIAAEVSGESVRLRFDLSARAQADFDTNRIGLCVLHPIDGLRGAACEIAHGNGSVETGSFPDAISPHVPFTDVRAMRYRVDGIDTRIAFEGDVFETEDQRNWSDTSYKTYCRPLALPRPYRVQAGQTVRQSVTVEITPPAHLPPVSTPPVRIGRAIGPMPRLGTVMNDMPSPTAIDRLRALSLAFLRHDAWLNDPTWRDRLDAVASLGMAIDLALHVDDAAALSSAAALPANVRRVTLYSNRRPVTDAALVEAARQAYPHLSIAGGTIGNFTELNRNRPPAGMLDALSYGVCPQIHAMDDLSIMENLAAQADAVRTARSFSAGVPLAVGPVTLHRRPDPFAAGNDGRQVVAPVDPRHAQPFAAAWTVGSLKHLLESGAATLIYYEAAGPHGLVDADGNPHPLYHVLTELSGYTDGEAVEVNDPQPLQYKALAVRKGDRVKLLLANVGWEPVTVQIEGNGCVTLPVHGTQAIEWEER